MLLREVIPGACSLLSNFITLNSMEASIAMGVQAVPVNKQEYIPYRLIIFRNLFFFALMLHMICTKIKHDSTAV